MDAIEGPHQASPRLMPRTTGKTDNPVIEAGHCGHLRVVRKKVVAPGDTIPKIGVRKSVPGRRPRNARRDGPRSLPRRSRGGADGTCREPPHLQLSPHMEQLRLSPCDAWLETGKAFARQSAPFDEIKYAKLHARLSDPRLQREKIRLPFFLIFSKGNYRTYEC
jgi:hypothetical protein